MFEYYVWAVCFMTLYVAVFWISINQYGEPKKSFMNKFPSVSIVVPAYNEEKNISMALDSLVNLDYPKDKLEILVVDDASTDSTVDVVNNYIKKYKFIRL